MSHRKWDILYNTTSDSYSAYVRWILSESTAESETFIGVYTKFYG